MNNDFTPFELAVKLKEKGFREPCFGWYYPSEVCGFDYKTTIVFNNSEYRGSNYKDMLISHKDEKHIDAPTISQVLKWLREEKKIVISIFPHPCGWQADIYKDVHCYYESEAERDLVYYHKEKTEISYSYNRLEINCIKYVLDNLI